MLLIQICVLLMVIIAAGIMCLSIILSKKNLQEYEKNSHFECGFNPLSKLRNSFSMQFFLLTIVFLIFDAEIALLVPCSMGMMSIQSDYWMIMVINFTLILIAGSLYEWYDGSLDWK